MTKSTASTEPHKLDAATAEDIANRFDPVRRMSAALTLAMFLFVVLCFGVEQAFGRRVDKQALTTFHHLMVLVALFIDFFALGLSLWYRQRAIRLDPLPRNTFALLVRWGFRTLMPVWFLGGATIVSSFVGMWAHQTWVIAVFGLVPAFASLLLLPKRRVVDLLVQTYLEAREARGRVVEPVRGAIE